MRAFIITLTVGLALAGCGSSRQDIASQERKRAKEAAFEACAASPHKRNRPTVVAKCYIGALNKYGGTELEYTVYRKALAISEKVESGVMTDAEAISEMDTFLYNLRMQHEALARQRQIEKNTRCIKERQRVSGSNYSGLDSPNGVVAVLSLLGAMADAATVADACN